ncbi:MAG: hypothetical protein AAF327_15415, partial [Cyanobacteria bacterium P01_A01_bin.37]
PFIFFNMCFWVVFPFIWVCFLISFCVNFVGFYKIKKKKPFGAPRGGAPQVFKVSLLMSIYLYLELAIGMFVSIYCRQANMSSCVDPKLY